MPKKRTEKSVSKRSLPREVKISIKASRAKKGENLVVLDLRGISSFTDYFVIMHGNSTRQNLALHESIEKELKKEKIRPLSIEGKGGAEWILMDYGSFIVHVFLRKRENIIPWRNCGAMPINSLIDSFKSPFLINTLY